MARVANLTLTTSGAGKVLNVAVPPKPSAKEMATLGNSILAAIQNHTNCQGCLSGIISVILQEEAAAAVQVNLAAG